MPTLAEYEGKVWTATRVKAGYKLTQPVPLELTTPAFMARFVAGILPPEEPELDDLEPEEHGEGEIT